MLADTQGRMPGLASQPDAQGIHGDCGKNGDNWPGEHPGGTEEPVDESSPPHRQACVNSDVFERDGRTRYVEIAVD